ncbi:uncharacterized protein [Drosophila virilis]|uniref:Uncharacterized protein n=1 Tax=Drosophila virilis TaxID=7244 RepID=A0A0Q9WCM7_DROVI|nr:uncharacterized protein LOC26530696 [Drosophila virilis]KRF78357.1 uncharacterized protein Dvir_GJ25926 [Drosophila virilis]
MRSHLAVYRAPENANGCQFARYAPHPLQPPAIWNAAAPNACYNLRAQLHHGLYHAGAGGSGAGPPPQQLLVNQQRINECAGIPLISNACSHMTPAQRHRLLRKSGKSWPAAAAAGTHSMSQLAAHAQGQPLLQNGNKQHHAQLQQQQQQYSPQSWPAHASSYQPMRLNNFQLTDKTRTLRYQNSAPAVLSAQEQQKTINNNNNNSNCAGQEPASSVPDTCLPRIIKPRKRRKKDRKPANGVLLKMETDLQPKLQQQQQAASYGQLLPLVNGGSRGSGMQQHDHSHGVCFCRDCDPLRSLWDYPLRSVQRGGGVSNSSSNSSTSTQSDNSCASSIRSRSVPNNFDETEQHFAPITGDSCRAEIVGVIGSQRSHAHSTPTPATTAPATAAAAPALYLSDSSDSGYGDILSGMNLANDLFASCFGPGIAADANAAETLLDASINEISRKLIETCAVNDVDGGGGGGDSSCAGDSDSGSASASDSGLDSAGSYNSEALVFNFEHLNLMDASFGTPTALDCNNNSNNDKQQFYNNCFDLVWRNNNSNNNNNCNDSSATPTTLILGTVGKLKPAFSTIS